ncbi:MAG: Uma2 family endonuclease [Thermomicrobiales bacterium]
MWLQTGDLAQPDLFCTLADTPARWSERGLEGSPALAIEVISPSNRRHDVVRKHALYAAAGVREYWLVDPETQADEVLELDGAEYRSRFFSDDAVVRSPMMTALAVPVAAVFEGIEGVPPESGPGQA